VTFTSGDRSFAAAGTRVSNSLPSNLRDEKLSFWSFRRLLKTHRFTADHSAMWTSIYCAIEIHLLTYLLVPPLLIIMRVRLQMHALLPTFFRLNSTQSRVFSHGAWQLQREVAQIRVHNNLPTRH